VTLNALTLYYGDEKINTLTVKLEEKKYSEIPPLAFVKLPINTLVSEDAWNKMVTEFKKSKSKFGIATKYTAGGKMDTLFKLKDK